MSAKFTEGTRKKMGMVHRNNPPAAAQASEQKRGGGGASPKKGKLFPAPPFDEPGIVIAGLGPTRSGWCKINPVDYAGRDLTPHVEVTHNERKKGWGLIRLDGEQVLPQRILLPWLDIIHERETMMLIDDAVAVDIVTDERLPQPSIVKRSMRAAMLASIRFRDNLGRCVITGDDRAYFEWSGDAEYMRDSSTGWSVDRNPLVGRMHKPPEKDAEICGSYRRKVSDDLSIQAVMWRGMTSTIVEVDADLSTGIGHLADVIAHSVTGGDTDPLLAAQIIAHRMPDAALGFTIVPRPGRGALVPSPGESEAGVENGSEPRQISTAP